MDDENVTFSVKDYRNKGQWKELTLSGVEFIRRFLMHVPPKRFVRIRHYGLLCSRSKHKKLTLCRNLLGCQKYLSKLRGKEIPEILKQLYEINICVCKSCGGHLENHSFEYHKDVKSLFFHTFSKASKLEVLLSYLFI